MKFKNLSVYFVLFFSSFLYFSQSQAIEIQIIPISETKVITKDETEITRRDFFRFIALNYKNDIPKTYQYINLNFKDIGNDPALKEALQILVYSDIIENKEIKLYPKRPLNAYTFYNFLDTKLNLYAIPSDETESELKKRNTKKYDLVNVNQELEKFQEQLNAKEKKEKNISAKQKIFTDVYDTLLTSHYDKDKLTEDKLINSAIDWLTKWTDDKFTTYFPPTEKNNFDADLNGKYEWIWAYVDMEIPWEFKIISAISWTPAELAWLKWWDIVTFVDSKEITKENTLQEVVSWIKWPAGTKVKLTVKRWEETLVIEIARAKIVIKEVEYKIVNNKIFYIQIKTFWDTVKEEFEVALNSMKENNNITTLILDLRNNPGWYLDQVTDMLWFFVPEGNPTAVIKYKDYKTTATSRWYTLIDFSKYKIIILQNSWTASASEIMIWTIKDYYPEATLIWEKTYWKWSVQTIKPYDDWSALKYTIAKWFTWKTETWIDLVWIKPDIEEKIDEVKYKEWYDSQLEKAIQMAK